MPEVKAQRKLVKSPPELWNELSDVQSLSRHLGEFGEIKITKLEPESTVEWQGERARGTVELSPAGWGTQVTITASLDGADGEAPQPAPPATASEALDSAGAELDAAQARFASAESELSAAVAGLQGAEEKLEAAQRAQPIAADFLEPEPASDPEPPAKGGFFARLFGWGDAAEADRRAEDERAARAERQAEAERRVADAQKRVEAQRAEAAERKARAERRVADAQRALEKQRAAVEAAETARAAAEERVAAERAEAERLAAETAREQERPLALLEDVLDHLGSAHHRPFSRG
jgi:hypothetical protein